MKRIILSLFASLISFSNLFSQKIITKTATIPLYADSVLLTVPANIRGQVFWQKSIDNKNWENMTDEEADSFVVYPLIDGMFRAKITEGTCNPIYSDTLKIITKETNGSLEVPKGVQNYDILISNFYEGTQPDNEGDFKLGSSNIITATNGSSGEIIYMLAASTQIFDYNSDIERKYELNAKETAIAITLSFLPFGYMQTSDETFTSIKNVLYALDCVKNLETAIASTINEYGYLKTDAFSTELKAVADFIYSELGLSESDVMQHNNNAATAKLKNVTASGFSKPFLNTDKARGVRLDINNAVFNENENTWNLNCTAYNENGIYLGLKKGWFTDNDKDEVTYRNDTETHYLPPMNVGKFYETFTSWSGLKEYFSDTKRLFTEGISHFDNMTWDMAKLEDIKMVLSKNENAIVVVSPGIDDRTMVVNFVYQSIGLINNFLDPDGINSFITELVTDVDLMLLIKSEYNNRIIGFTKVANEITEKFKIFMQKETVKWIVPDVSNTIKYVSKINEIITNAGNVAGCIFSWKTFETFAFEVIAEYNATLPEVITTEIDNITSSTASGGGNITSDEGAAITARGVCWNAKGNPTINDSKTSNGTGTGSFTANLPNLTSNTTYYVRAYATNSAGTAYGEQLSFTTAQSINLPTISTVAISNITTTSAISGGNVTNDGGATITTRGVCWNTEGSPTINDSKTCNGNGTGNYSASLTELSENTAYYARAYATNSMGTAYGEEISFTTTSKSVENVYGSFTDPRDRRTYKTVVIATQIWMAENLAYLPYISPTSKYSFTDTCYYLYDYEAYGVLYNWSAAINACPVGWHLPSDEEWTLLSNYLGGESVAGGKMKTTTGWNRPNEGDTNESGFSALLGGGNFYSSGGLSLAGNYGRWWTSTSIGVNSAFTRYLEFNNTWLYRSGSVRLSGYSVRCLKD